MPRALPVSELQEQALSHELEGVCFEQVNEALEQAKLNAEPKDVILVTGSTFVVAELEGL